MGNQQQTTKDKDEYYKESNDDTQEINTSNSNLRYQNFRHKQNEPINKNFNGEDKQDLAHVENPRIAQNLNQRISQNIDQRKSANISVKS